MCKQTLLASTTRLVYDLRQNQDEQRALAMKKYMKNRFEFFGLPSADRKLFAKPGVALMKEEKDPFRSVQELFAQPQRELHYVAMEAFFKYRTLWSAETLSELEWMIMTNSWWDSVDFIASNCVGYYLSKDSRNAREVAKNWIDADSMWLRRSALLFQLKYKEKTDQELLAYLIEKTQNEKEFFIRKAIGWSLRQYAKFNPDWVVEFVNSHSLQNLSRKEALKHL